MQAHRQATATMYEMAAWHHHAGLEGLTPEQISRAPIKPLTGADLPRALNPPGFFGAEGTKGGLEAVRLFRKKYGLPPPDAVMFPDNGTSPQSQEGASRP
jgi:hypothetical protein